jgi:thiol:disulfide interchange protein
MAVDPRAGSATERHGAGAVRSVALAAMLAAVAGCQPSPAAAEAAAPTPTPRAAAATEAAAAPAPDPAAIAALDAKFDPARDAAADLQLAMAEAQRSGRRIVLDVGGEWCPWCHRMDAFLHDDAELHALRAAGYVWMKVNYSEENENAAFLAGFPEVKGYPHLFVLDADGKLLHSQFTGTLEKGKSYDREKFLAVLKAWAPQHS